MDYVVIDTDVASWLQRGTLPHALASRLTGTTLCITFVTVGEFYKGAYKRAWGPRRIALLEDWLRRVVVLPYDGGVARWWGRISAAALTRGRAIPANDAWIAASCLSRSLPLATMNHRHFESIENLLLIP